MRQLVFAILASVGMAAGQTLDGPATSELLERIANQRQGRTVQVDFEERKTLPMMREPVVERGTLAFEAPDKFLRRTDGGRIAVSDGRDLWMYYPEFAQAERYRLSGGAGPGELLVALGRIFQLHDVRSSFRVTAEELPDGWRLILRPRSSAIRRFVREARLELDRRLALRSSWVESPGGERTEAAYSNERFTGGVDFRFEPPPGTTVVAPGG